MRADDARQTDLQRGFTLLEVLMVVLLVGIISSVVMLNVNTGGTARQLQEETDRLAALLEQATNEAVMQNQEYGLRLTPHGYAFLCLDETKQRWAACKDEIFRERELADGLELRLLQQGAIKELPATAAKSGTEEGETQDTDQNDSKSKRITPDIFLLSSGEASAASLELRAQDSDDHREVRIDEIGRVTVAGAGNDTAPTGEQSNGR